MPTQELRGDLPQEMQPTRPFPQAYPAATLLVHLMPPNIYLGR